MATSRPFMFDGNDFDRQAEASAVPPELRPQFTQQEMDAALQSAESRGREEGMAEATESQNAQIARMMEILLQQVGALSSAEAAREKQSQQLAIDVASELLRKLMPELANQPALEGISALVRQVMMDRFEEPRLIIRVHDSVLDNLTARLKDMAAQSGFNGQYALMADTHLAPTDCRIEWSNGGVERSAVRLWENMQVTLENLKAGLPGTPSQTPDITPDESEQP